jgi:hypothetical protein
MKKNLENNMTTQELKQIDDSIIKHGDDFWNEDNSIEEGIPESNRGWIVEELLFILAKDNYDLKLIPKQ